MITLVNATPHAIKVQLGDNVQTFPPSGIVPRVSIIQTPDGTLNGIPVYVSKKGHVSDLPSPIAGTYFIVSAIVLAASDRIDLVAPDTANAIRNDKGHIIAVPRFVR